MIHHSRVLDTNVLDDMIALTTMALQRGMDATTATNAVLCVGDMFWCVYSQPQTYATKLARRYWFLVGVPCRRGKLS